MVLLVLLAGCASPARVPIVATQPCDSPAEGGRVAYTQAELDALVHDCRVAPSLHPDFTHEMVVGYSWGRQPTGGYGVRITEAYREDALRVVVVLSEAGHGCMTPQIETSPGQLAVVARSTSVSFDVRHEVHHCE